MWQAGQPVNLLGSAFAQDTVPKSVLIFAYAHDAVLWTAAALAQQSGALMWRAEQPSEPQSPARLAAD